MGNTREIDTSGFKDLYPFQSHFFDRNGLKMHYLDEGQGPAVVMVHGNPTWSFYYRNLVTCLSREYRTIVPDHIGCGLSDKPQNGEYDYRYKSRVADLEALLDHLVPDGPITLIVHDWGGPIGLAWALGRPERISRLVITNTAAFLAIEGKTVPWQLRLIRNVAPAATLLVQGFNAFSRGALYMAAKRPLSREVKTRSDRAVQLMVQSAGHIAVRAGHTAVPSGSRIRPVGLGGPKPFDFIRPPHDDSVGRAGFCVRHGLSVGVEKTIPRG
jgi:pimeloyl-ACP methyl ester carboxylesterase